MPTFTKHDQNKVRFELVEPQFVEGVAKVLTIGSEKYDDNNWKKCDDISRYEGALMRHLFAYLDGEKVDPESGLSHLYHLSTNAMFLDFFDRVET